MISRILAYGPWIDDFYPCTKCSFIGNWEYSTDCCPRCGSRLWRRTGRKVFTRTSIKFTPFFWHAFYKIEWLHKNELPIWNPNPRQGMNHGNTDA